MVIISMVVMSMLMLLEEYGRRRSGLSKAPLDMEYDNNSYHRDIYDSHIPKHTK